MVVYCRFAGYGQVDREALTVEEYKAKTELPDERWLWYEGRPRPTKIERYELELTPAPTLAWKSNIGNDLYPSKVLADKLVVRFLKLSQQVTRESNRKPW